MFSYPVYVECHLDRVYFYDEVARRAVLDKIRREYPGFVGRWTFRRSQTHPNAVRVLRYTS